ncbi:MAG: toll/interleukin-1 receptor domain-containing protein, partial [Anaerolineae bacterium]|nr:toll/interleukin-1 receptor domain-containing protein [Anaerolineae bacterium]
MSNYDVFISYSRRDDADGFITRLRAALEGEGLTVWMDDKIVSSAEWWTQIETHIERSNNFLLLISEHSLSSEWCQQEIAHALAFGKRFIPFQLSTIDEQRVKGGWLDQPWEQIARENWEPLRKVQWITDYLNAPEFDTAVVRIRDDARTDPAHVELHTRLLLQAQAWQNSGQSPGAHIGGDPLVAAETWLADWDALSKDNKTLPAPTTMQRDFLNACRAAEDEIARLQAEQEHRTHELETQTQRAAAENERLGRRTARFRIAALIAAVIGVIALVATVVAIGQTNEARDAEAIANTHEFEANGTAVAAATSAADARFQQATAIAANATAESARLEALAQQAESHFALGDLTY